jgi:hypothetical protein
VTYLPRSIQTVTWQRLHAVDIDRITGLTFFFIRGELCGIHPHRSKNSCATDTFERFSNRRQLSTVWVYMPIAPRDRVLVLGTRLTDLGFSVLVSSHGLNRQICNLTERTRFGQSLSVT